MKARVVDSDPRWEEEGLYWAQRIRDILNGCVLDIDHIGSTAVPGLAAKDVIDIQTLAYDLDEAQPAIAALKSAGFLVDLTKRGETPRPGYPDHPDCWDRLLFRGPRGERPVILHLREVNTAGARVPLLLRDFLRADDLVREQYGALKLGLARYVESERGYQAMKQPFVAVTLRLAEAWAERTRWRLGQSDA
ncbi:MAG: GrpB family protein [Hyphomonadaceae bacterium]|nr:MAG: dephospho-CoA kinase [Caulobacteraceae bacterium]MBT9446833.1 GrpB family protein [Hyphomonadaceae bacterium]TPW03090.1 MAG: dephospho-CoA kinase [Alphaproteobacteria bacterium]